MVWDRGWRHGFPAEPSGAAKLQCCCALCACVVCCLCARCVPCLRDCFACIMYMSIAWLLSCAAVLSSPGPDIDEKTAERIAAAFEEASASGMADSGVASPSADAGGAGAGAVSAGAAEASGGAVAGGGGRAGDMADWVVEHSGDGKGASGKVPLRRSLTADEPNCWSRVSASLFHLRGKSYLTDHVKVPSVEPVFRAVGTTAFVSKAPLVHAASVVPQLRDYIRANRNHFFFVLSWLLPGHPSHACIHVFCRDMPGVAGSSDADDPVFEPLFQVRRLSTIRVFLWCGRAW